MSQKETIQNFGFSEKGAKLILKKLDYFGLNVNTFILNFESFKKIVNSYKYSDRTVRNMLIQDPRLVKYHDRFEKRYDNMKNLLPGNAKDGNVMAVCLILLPETLNEKVKMIKSYGFTNEDLKKALAKDPKIIRRSKDSFDKLFDFFEDLGVSKKNIIRLIVNYSCKLFMHFDMIEDNLDRLLGYGFSKKEVGKLINNINEVIVDETLDIDGVFKLFREYGLADEDIRTEIINHTKIVKYNEEEYSGIIDYLKKKDFTDEEIKYVTLIAKEIIASNADKISYLYDAFYKYKFDDESIKHVIIKNPKVLYHTSDKIINILDKLEKYNIREKDLIKVAVGYPNVFETSVETLNEKLKVISGFDLMEAIYSNPKNLIQGAEKTYLRYLYMFNVLEIEPITLSEINVLFRKNASITIEDENTHKKIKYTIPDIDELRKEFTYYKDEGDLIEIYKGRKCVH